jgi:hypothetical protein
MHKCNAHICCLCFETSNPGILHRPFIASAWRHPGDAKVRRMASVEREKKRHKETSVAVEWHVRGCFVAHARTGARDSAKERALQKKIACGRFWRISWRGAGSFARANGPFLVFLPYRTGWRCSKGISSGPMQTSNPNGLIQSRWVGPQTENRSRSGRPS